MNALPVLPPAALLLDQLQLAYVAVDPAGVVTDANDTLLALTGYTRAEVLGQPYARLFMPPAQRPGRQAYLEQLLAQQDECPASYDSELLTKAGTTFWLEWRLQLLRDEQGRVTGMWAAEHRRTAAELAARHQLPPPEPAYLREFFNSSHDLILHLAHDNSLLFVNKAGQEKLGYSEEQLRGQQLAMIVHPYYSAKLVFQLKRLYLGEALNKVETVMMPSNGRPIHLIGSVSSERLPGQEPTARVVLHDITDRIKAERLQKVYYSIANLAISTSDLPALYAAIHRELGKVIETKNIFIALCDDERTQLEFVYYVDQHAYFEQGGGRPFSMGVTEYVIQREQPMFFTQADLLQLMRDGEMTLFGRLPAVLLASPLTVDNRTIGVLTVQEYEQADLYSPADLDILHFISNQVALGIDRKRKEEHLARQNARLRSIFESGTHLMWSLDRQGGLISFNQNYADFYQLRNGIPPNQGLSLPERNLAHDNKALRQMLENHYQAACQGEAQKFEVNLHNAQGHDLWLSMTLDPIYLPDGSFEEIAGQAQDITASKNSQLVLATQEEKFRSIFESFQDVYYRTDEQGRLTILSPSVYEVMGYDPALALGHPTSDYYNDPGQHEAILEALALSGELRNFETQLRHRDGYAVSVLINARRTSSGTEGIARDITEIRRIQDDLRLAKEEAEAASAAKTQFLANMSHELRTPMNGIIGMIDLLGQTTLTDEQTDFVDTLRTSSDALLTILNDILDLSKIQAGKMRLNESPLVLDSLCARLHSLFAYGASQKNLRFTCHLSPSTPPVIESDEMRLLQILSNLVANAIKFTTHGTVSIIVSTVGVDDGEYTLRFAVQDSGIGISSDDAARLFTSFTQLDTTPSKAYGGTGLGLAISKELAELLGGSIGVLSDVGEGSIFWFTIRCRVPLTSAVAVPVELLPDGPLVQQDAYVLLVDDNAINQKVASSLLAKLGCRVDVASDGYEAIARATAPDAPYQLILMDIQMPGLDGIEATRAIRDQLGEASPPIVAMTAYSMPDDGVRFVKAGLDGYLAKPVKHQQLAQTLARWVAPRPEPQPQFAELPPAPPLLDAMLDAETLAQLQELTSVEFAAGLYDEFAHEATPLLQQVAACWQAHDLAGLQPLLHQLKGTAATLGLTALAAQAQTLEHNIKKGDFTTLPIDFSQLQQYFAYFLLHYHSQVSVASQAVGSQP